MPRLISRQTYRVIAATLFLLQPSISTSGDSFRYLRVPRENVEARLSKYVGDDKQREVTLRQMFADAGCDTEHISEQQVKGLTLPNVICVLPGSSDRVIVVGAHYDHVSTGDGVVDNWSGASLLPSLYESVKFDPRRHTFIFIGFAGEEQGLIGSHFYVRQMTKQQVAAIDAMVNMDALGLGPTDVWMSHSDKQLTIALISIAKQRNLPIAGVNVERVGTTDSEEFADRKIPRITIHSLTQESWNANILHTSKDKLSAVHLDDYYQTYILLAAYVVFLDQFLGPANSQMK